MATVLRHGRYRVVIYSNDHRPAHVHVLRGKRLREAEAVFELQCPGGPPVLDEIRGNMTPREANRISRWLSASLEDLCSKWRGIHGDF